jgi:glycosyltransferase involved in cell wall biosynthesis
MKAIIYYGGFEYRGGGAFMHARILCKELERAGWQVDLITLERLPLLLRYLPHIVGRVLNFLRPPMGFYFKDRLTGWLYKLMFNHSVQMRIFEDIYLSWNSGTPSVTILHAVWSDNLQSIVAKKPVVRKLVAAEEMRIDSIEHPIVIVSDAYHQFLSQTHLASSRLPDIHVVPLGVDLAEFDGSNEALVAEKSLIYCGAMEARKNLRFLLLVFKRLQERDPDYRLTIIGDGADGAFLKEFCVQNKLQVTFLGRLGRVAVLKELRRHRLYVHPSVKESFSLSLLEAKLSGLTTIAYGGLEVPAEFIDVPVSSFDEDEWLAAIARGGAVQTIEVDAARYSSQRMMVKTLELAHESAGVDV